MNRFARQSAIAALAAGLHMVFICEASAQKGKTEAAARARKPTALVSPPPTLTPLLKLQQEVASDLRKAVATKHIYCPVRAEHSSPIGKHWNYDRLPKSFKVDPYLSDDANESAATAWLRDQMEGKPFPKTYEATIDLEQWVAEGAADRSGKRDVKRTYYWDREKQILTARILLELPMRYPLRAGAQDVPVNELKPSPAALEGGAAPLSGTLFLHATMPLPTSRAKELALLDGAGVRASIRFTITPGGGPVRHLSDDRTGCRQAAAELQAVEWKLFVNGIPLEPKNN